MGISDLELRSIEPININGLDIGRPENGEPICERVDPRLLYDDPSYQRDIGERGLRQIRRIIEDWDWNKFQPPSCAYAEVDGRTVLKVLDGQHTSIAAASHPDIDKIPVMIHEAKETAAQAAAFVGQNSGRLTVTQLQMHRAGLIAGDLDAKTLEAVCDRANLRVLPHPPSRGAYKPRETVAIAAIRTLIDKRGADTAAAVLTVVSNAKLMPVTADHIRAAEQLMTDSQYCGDFDPVDLQNAIELGGRDIEKEAKIFASAHSLPYWKGLAVQWFRKTRKRRGRSA